jgi:hypothetical protein
VYTVEHATSSNAGESKQEFNFKKFKEEKGNSESLG